jgi:uncharacterized membrane protein
MHALLGRTERPARLMLRLDPPVQAVFPGHRVRFALRIENRGASQAIDLVVDGESSDWKATLPVHRVLLPPGECTTIFLRVDAPADALSGTRESFRVGANAGSGRWRWHEVECLVEAA